MIRRVLPAVLVFVLTTPLMADDKADAKKLKGTWAREVNDTKISFEFKDEKNLRCVIMPGGNDGPVVDCEYTFKDGVVDFTITEIDKKGNDALPDKGTKFSFKVVAEKDKLTISEFKGTEDPGAKGLVEGEYKKQ